MHPIRYAVHSLKSLQDFRSTSSLFQASSNPINDKIVSKNKFPNTLLKNENIVNDNNIIEIVFFI